MSYNFKQFFKGKRNLEPKKSIRENKEKLIQLRSFIAVFVGQIIVLIHAKISAYSTLSSLNRMVFVIIRSREIDAIHKFRLLKVNNKMCRDI